MLFKIWMRIPTIRMTRSCIIYYIKRSSLIFCAIVNHHVKVISILMRKNPKMSKESFLRNALTVSAALFLEAWFYFLVGSKQDPDSQSNLDYAWPESSVVNPDWIRIQWFPWIRFWIRIRNPGGEKWSRKI